MPLGSLLPADHRAATANSTATGTHSASSERPDVSTFSQKEIEYLRGQRLGRLATVGPGGSPHVVPVGFRLSRENDAIEIGGHAIRVSKKWRDLQANPRVAFVIDDLERVDPGLLAGSRCAAAPSCTTRAARVSAAGGMPHGYGSFRSGSSPGGSRRTRSPMPGGVTLARLPPPDPGNYGSPWQPPPELPVAAVPDVWQGDHPGPAVDLNSTAELAERGT